MDEEQKIKMYCLHKTGLSFRDIAKRYDISSTLVHNFVKQIDAINPDNSEKIDLIQQELEKEKDIQDEQLRQQMLKEQEEYFKTLPSWEEIKKTITKTEGIRKVPTTLKKRVLFRDNNTCRVCGKKYFLELHHIRLVMFGGEEKPENGITLCWQCHHEAPDDPHLLIEILKIGIDVRAIQFLEVARWAFIGIGQYDLYDKFRESFKKEYNQLIKYRNEEINQPNPNNPPLSSGCTNNQSEGETNGS